MVICLEQGAELHTAQLRPLPLTVSGFSKIQIGFTFLVPAHPGSPGKRAVKQMCVSVQLPTYAENMALHAVLLSVVQQSIHISRLLLWLMLGQTDRWTDGWRDRRPTVT